MSIFAYSFYCYDGSLIVKATYCNPQKSLLMFRLQLQENIQTQYIRVAELLKEIKELEEIIRRVSKQPEMAEKQR